MLTLSVPALCEHLIRRQDTLLQRLRSLDDDEWTRPTRCPGWRVRDVAWHVGWGRGPGEVIEAARQGTETIPYATSRMGPTPEDVAAIVGSMEAKCEATRADLASLSPSEHEMTIRYGTADGRPLVDHLWAMVVEAYVHGDDLDTAIGIDEPMPEPIAMDIVRRMVRGAVMKANADALRPRQPRGYAYRCAAEPLAGFRFDGDAWLEGFTDDASTCVFEADPTTLARLVMGRIPIAPFEGTPRRPWDERLRISGAVTVAPPSDVLRWCYGAW
jgi:uncharacterized protein (TIGR03083 family)